MERNLGSITTVIGANQLIEENCLNCNSKEEVILYTFQIETDFIQFESNFTEHDEIILNKLKNSVLNALIGIGFLLLNPSNVFAKTSMRIIQNSLPVVLEETPIINKFSRKIKTKGIPRKLGGTILNGSENSANTLNKFLVYLAYTNEQKNELKETSKFILNYSNITNKKTPIFKSLIRNINSNIILSNPLINKSNIVFTYREFLLFHPFKMRKHFLQIRGGYTGFNFIEFVKFYINFYKAETIVSLSLVILVFFIYRFNQETFSDKEDLLNEQEEKINYKKLIVTIIIIGLLLFPASMFGNLIIGYFENFFDQDLILEHRNIILKLAQEHKLNQRDNHIFDAIVDSKQFFVSKDDNLKSYFLKILGYANHRVSRYDDESLLELQLRREAFQEILDNHPNIAEFAMQMEDLLEEYIKNQKK